LAGAREQIYMVVFFIYSGRQASVGSS